jgi:aspartyl-tRNA(Asn)/glutamyl-tRNA(Gln) amidotransferase subunit B
LTGGEEARACLARLRQLVVYLGVSDGNLAEGSLRCDVNVSVRPAGTPALGVKSELKNLNSLRAVQRGVDYEIQRQCSRLEAGLAVRKETRAWDADRRRTYRLRTKEELEDYRYFPEPDLPPLILNRRELTAARAALPELPIAREARLASQYDLSFADAALLAESPELADYFESLAEAIADSATAARWIRTDVRRLLNRYAWCITEFPVAAERLAGLLVLVRDGELTTSSAKEVLLAMLTDPAPAKIIVGRGGWDLIDDKDRLETAVSDVLAEHAGEVADYLGGKDSLFEFFVGQVMRATAGRADPGVVRELLHAALARR